MEKNDLNNSSKCVVIGGSAGSLKVLLEILPGLSAAAIDFPIIIILHRKNDRRSSLEHLLNNCCTLSVKEAEDKETLKGGTIYTAPPDYHLLIEKEGTLSLDASEKVSWSRPSIDVTFQSAAEVFKDNLLAVLLSGANNDGSLGLQKIKDQGGKIMIQHPENAEISTMPQLALETIQPDYLVKDTEMSAIINQF